MINPFSKPLFIHLVIKLGIDISHLTSLTSISFISTEELFGELKDETLANLRYLMNQLNAPRLRKMVIVVFLETEEDIEKLVQIDRDLADAKFNDLEDIRIGLHATVLEDRFKGGPYAFLRKVKGHFPLMSKRSTFRVDSYCWEHYWEDIIEYPKSPDMCTSRYT